MELTQLRIYQASKEIVISVYSIINKIPACEKYNLIDQMRRCSVSVLGNIAESEGTNTKKAKVNFLFIARGSLYELLGYLLLISELYTIQIENNIINKIETLIKQINANIKTHTVNLKY